MNKAVMLAAVALPLVLPGCVNETAFTGHRAGLFAGIGGIGCGALASGLSRGSAGGRLLGGLLAGGTCAAIGHEIGRELDEADRERMQRARAFALQQRLPPQYYQAGYQAPGSYQTASGYGGANPSGGLFSRFRSAPGNSSSSPADAPLPSPSASSGRFPGLSPVQGAQWVSDHSGATGSVTVVSAEKPKDGHGECRNLVQTVRQSGEAPVSEAAKFCESRPGANDWAKL